MRGPAWSEGVDGDFLRDLVGYRRGGFDWRAQEHALNRLSHFCADVEEVRLHFVHERGRGPDPLPLILTHGWPSTFYELVPLIPLLTDAERAMLEQRALGQEQGERTRISSARVRRLWGTPCTIPRSGSLRGSSTSGAIGATATATC